MLVQVGTGTVSVVSLIVGTQWARPLGNQQTSSVQQNWESETGSKELFSKDGEGTRGGDIDAETFQMEWG